MLSYFDSSAVVVLLRRDERDREPIVVGALAEATDAVGTEYITPLEVTAAIHRGLGARDRRAAEERWEGIWSRTVSAALDAALYELAQAAVRRHHLRSLDAFHLAAALRLGCTRMITFDTELGGAARQEGLEVVGVSRSGAGP